jgi:Domain of unknown function (DUF4157)
MIIELIEMYLNNAKKSLLNKSQWNSRRMAIPSASPSLTKLLLQEHDNFLIPHVQLKSICPCDGTCPRCKATANKADISLIQTKLKVSEPDDPLEREADKIAEQVVGMNYDYRNPTESNYSTGEEKYRNCSMCEEQFEVEDDQDSIQITRKSITNEFDKADDTNEINNEIKNVVSEVGKPLDTQTKEFMESRFGYDFSNVRIHTEKGSFQSARLLDAHAYTVGNHIVFREGLYQPNTSDGIKLLAHELTHVYQKRDRRERLNTPPAISKVQRKPKGSKKQQVEPQWDLQRTGKPHEFYLTFTDFVSRQYVLEVLFVDGKIAPGFTLEGDTYFTTHWKLTLPPNLSFPYAPLNPKFVSRAIDPYFSPLTLTPEETTAYRERSEKSLDTYLSFINMTVREALEKYPAPSWGEVGGYFMYVGWDGSRKFLSLYPLSKTNEIYNRDMRYYLGEGLTPYQAEALFKARWDAHSSAIMNAMAVVTGAMNVMKRPPTQFGYQKTGVKVKPSIDPAQFGSELGKSLKGAKGSFFEIAEQISSKEMSQAKSVIAAEEATKAMGLRLVTVEMADGNIIVSSVRAGPNQPVLVVSTNGKVAYASATIMVSTTNPRAPLIIKDIVAKIKGI